MNITLYQLAYQLSKTGRKAEARRLLEHILRIDNTNEQAWLLYADCFYTRAERIQALEACIHLNPNAWSAVANLAALHRASQQDENPNGLFPLIEYSVEPKDEFKLPEFLSQPQDDNLPPGLVTGSLAGKLPLEVARKLTQDAQKAKAPADQPAAATYPEPVNLLAVEQPSPITQPEVDIQPEAESHAEAEAVEAELPTERESMAETRPLRARSTELASSGETQPPADALSTTGDLDLPDLIFSTSPLDEDDLSEAADLSAPDVPAVILQPEEAVLPNAGLLDDGITLQPEVDEALDDALAQRLGWYQQDSAGDPLFSSEDPSWALTVWQQSDEPEAENELLETETSLPVTGFLAANLESSAGLWWTHDPSSEESLESQPLGRPLPGFAPAVSGQSGENEVGDPWMRSVRSYLTESEEAEKSGKTRGSRTRAKNLAVPGSSSARSTRPFLVALIIMLTFMIVTVMVLIGALLLRS